MTGPDVQASARALPTRVLVVDDHELFRRGLLMLLSHEPDIEVIAECGDAAESLDLAERMRPDLVLFDIRLSEGAEACRGMIEALPGIRILMLVTSADEAGLAEAAAAGASGYLLKETSLDEVAAAIRTAADGVPAWSPSSGSTASFLESRNLPDRQEAAALQAVRADTADLC